MRDVFALFPSFSFSFSYFLVRAVQQILGVGRNLDATTGRLLSSKARP
jgi:hypothetical protein